MYLLQGRATGLRPDLQLLPGMYLLQGRATGLRPDLQLLPGMYLLQGRATGLRPDLQLLPGMYLLQGRATGLRPDLQLLPGMYLLQGRATGLRPDLQLLPGMYLLQGRATGLRPDLQLLPEGDATVLGSRGTPLSGGQRVRVGVARALYSRARLVALDEPLGALDAALARHVVARALVPAARAGRTVLLATNRLELMHYADLVSFIPLPSTLVALDAALARHVVARALVPAARAGRTVLLATNRLELMHYADMILVMEEGRVSAFGRPGGAGGVLARWARLAAEARAGAARGAGGGGGGAARERTRLVRALSRATIQRRIAQDVSLGSCSVAGAHLLTEVAVCGGSWRVSPPRRPPLCRQLSSPPPANK
ncbi:unnamed protein product [Plutella xylostella]|uniref:(diamondback moth) hypothetical protein n=1 Tax=Plutella xylostella TaxID=51655 RepID=A0A8S4DEA7_PLUXY|nr:unnamed protein product [Plutella xylostella]